MTDLPVEQTWIILVRLLTNLRKKGTSIPPEVTEDIRMAKTTINFYKVDPTDPERMKELKRINDFINSAQDVLLDLAQNIGEDYHKVWTEKLKRAARGEEVYKTEEKKPKFVVGVPSGFSMVRVTFKEPLSEDRLQEIAEEYQVIIEFEEDNVIVIYGDDPDIKRSLKEISLFFKEQIDKESNQD
jgi:hypothetical protein